jgi:beta-phosphoglucomutase-like phosphatase (HAD superfamily)
MNIDLERSAHRPDLQKAIHELFSKSMASMSRRDRRKVERSIKKASLKK